MQIYETWYCVSDLIFVKVIRVALVIGNKDLHLATKVENYREDLQKLST